MNEAPIAWRRVSKGLSLVGVGFFLLLTTLGVLTWSFWIDAFSFWPILLVALGLRLVFERSRVPWLALLSPLLILGTLCFVALRRPAVAGDDGDWTEMRLERPQEAGPWTLQGMLALTKLEIIAGPVPPDVLVQGRSWPSRRGGIRLTRERGRDRVRVASSWRGVPFIIVPGPTRACELGLAPDLPVALDLDLAFTHGRIDLAAAPVTRVALDGAFNHLRLRLGAPTSEVRLQIDGTLNQIELDVPPSTPVTSVTDGFINIVDGRRGASELKGPGYRLSLDGAFNRVIVRSL